MAEHFVEIKIPQQRNYNSIAFPSVLSPKPPTVASALAEKIRTQKPFLESLLLKAGAVLFRGFADLKTASDFNDVVEAFGYEEFPYLGGGAPRNHVVGRVCTANESPPDQKIHFHHEMCQVLVPPSKLLFFCEVEPASGGETPLVLSHCVYERRAQKHPEFGEQLEQHGLIYTRVVGDQDNPLYPYGRGWKSSFSTDDKGVAEERATKLGIKLEWRNDGGVKMIMGPILAVKYDEIRQRKVWFNTNAASYTWWKDAGKDDRVQLVTFGNGEPLPGDGVEDCLKILEEESIAIPWQKGDVLLIDNWAVLHARRSFTSPRRILASLCK